VNQKQQQWREYTQALLLAAGGVAQLAPRLGRSKQALYSWRRVPEGLVEPLEALTGHGITRYHWRPDLYGMPEGPWYRGHPLPRIPPALRQCLQARAARHAARYRKLGVLA
jgi:hypothetical protein